MIKIFNIILRVIYIFSGVYFLTINVNILNFLLCIFCLSGSFAIEYLRKKSIIRTDGLSIVSDLFLLFSTILGTCYGFYGLIKGYDDFLHIWSGFIAVAVAFNILLITNKDDLNISKLFVVIYLFMFSMGVASIWEIIEFFLDSFLGMNTQAGGLNDTMVDMIDGLIGTVVMISFYSKRIKKYGKQD